MAAISDREQRGLHGPVKSCIEETIHSGATADDKTHSQFRYACETEYDIDGRILLIRQLNSNGSDWVTRYFYDISGRLLKTASGIEGEAPSETNFSYDQEGRLHRITDASKPDYPAVLHYDERGLKSRIETSRPEDYRPNLAVAGTPFQSLSRAPNLPGGGSAVTIFDELDRPTEVKVFNQKGELVNRAIRTYDASGRAIREEQILDSPESMIPSEIQAIWLKESGFSADQLRQEMRAQITKLMAGQAGPYAVSYGYDSHGRVNHSHRRIFNREDDIETTYNEYGDMKREITRSTRAEGDSTVSEPQLHYSEVLYSSEYDQRGNWIEQAIAYRNDTDSTFQPSTVTKRTLTYY